MKKQEHELKEVETNLEDVRRKVRLHRSHQLKRAALVVACCVGVVVLLYVVSQVKTYSKYKVMDTIERSDTSATRFETFQGKILKYSNDGAIYTDVHNDVIWNQSFEMDSPMLSKNEAYIAFADLDGQEIYVLNASGLQGTIRTNMSIQRIDVTAQGSVAVLTENQQASYLSLYNIEGELLAEGAIHVENSGFPMDIAVSEDGTKLAVSILDVASGSVKTTLSFYNFGTMGQNQIDNLVKTYSYAGCIVPELEYVDDTTMLAFADTGVMVFKGSQVPELSKEVLVSTEIKSIFYDDTYFGLILQDGEAELGRRLAVYDMNGTEVAAAMLDMAYEQVYFMNNHEVCLQNDTQIQIYNLHGIKKLEAAFDAEVYYMIDRMGVRNYYALLEGRTEDIRGKFFSSTRFEEDSEE